MANLGSLPEGGRADVVLPSSGAQANRRSLVLAGTACLAAALVLVGAHLFAFDAVIAAAAVFLSTDGLVESANVRALSATLFSAAALAVLAGGLLVALSVPAWRMAFDAAIRWDPLRRFGFDVPNAHVVLVSSATLGTLVIGMHLFGSRLGGPIGPLFRREGLFELLTVALELFAVVCCVAAARGFSQHRGRMPRSVPWLHGALAVVLFMVAMEELNWGQTLLAFDTPSAWAAINYQQEMSLHNLIDGQTLTVVERTLVVLFGVGVLALIALALKSPRSAVAAIAPPAALGALAMLCAIPGAYLRLEVTELLLALFFAFYSYRLYIAGRSRVWPDR
jgi:hypothetical protein